MDQARVVFADNLTRKVFRVSGQLISKIDIVLNHPALFEKLVREGTIKRDEADFLVEHISEFNKIYSTYSNVHNRKLISKNYILQTIAPKQIINTKSLNNNINGQQADNKTVPKEIVSGEILTKINCYVVSGKNKKCPICHKETVPKVVKVNVQNRSVTVNMRKCLICGCFTVSYPTYRTNARHLNCINYDAVNQFKSEYEQKHQKKTVKTKKKKVLPPLPPIKQTIKPRINTYCEFKLYSLSSKQEIAVSIQDSEKSLRKTDQWFLTNHSTIGTECLKAIANGIYIIKLENIDYKIQDLHVYDAKYIKRYKDDTYYFKHANINNNKNPHIVDCGSDYVDVYVYFILSNSCLNEQHPVESVTMRSLNSQTGKRYQVNAYYCSKCKKYFINHEAVKDLINRNMYPAFHYITADHYDGELKPMSQLMLYGYNARADGPSTVARHNILKWVIDSGLMSKPEIIKDLQFKIAYNGKRPGNEAARDKWEDDLDFLNTYVSDNRREIRGKLKR